MNAEPTARAVLLEGARRLVARPGGTAVALAAGALSSLAMTAAGLNFGGVVARHEQVGPAIGAWLLVALASALVAGAGLQAALSSDVRPGRAVALVGLRWFEIAVLGALSLAAMAPFAAFAASHNDAPPVQVALAFIGSIAGPLLVGLFAVPAFRVARAKTAAGDAAWVALGEGFQASFTRFGALLRLLLAAVIVTAPLWLLTLAIERALAAMQHPRWTLVLTGAVLRGALSLLAAAWVYASLVVFVDGGALEVTAATPPPDPSSVPPPATPPPPPPPEYPAA